MGASIVAFMVPSLCFVYGLNKAGIRVGYGEKIRHFTIVGFGIVVMFVTLGVNFYEMIVGGGGDKDCKW